MTPAVRRRAVHGRVEIDQVGADGVEKGPVLPDRTEAHRPEAGRAEAEPVEDERGPPVGVPRLALLGPLQPPAVRLQQCRIAGGVLRRSGELVGEAFQRDEVFARLAQGVAHDVGDGGLGVERHLLLEETLLGPRGDTPRRGPGRRGPTRYRWGAPVSVSSPSDSRSHRSTPISARNRSSWLTTTKAPW